MDKGSRKEQTIIVKIICLLLSFGLWLYVSNVENPVRTHEIKDIPVEILNEKALTNSGFAISDFKQFTVDLKIEGASSEVTKVKKEDFKVAVDMSAYALKSGENTIPVQILSYPDNINIKNNGFLGIRIRLEELIKKQISIKSNVKVSYKENIYEKEEKLNPSTVTVSGAKSIIDKISEAVIRGDITELDKNYTNKYKIQFLDSAGNEIYNINSDVDEAELSIIVEHGKKVPINVKTKGELTNGATLGEITVIPSELNILGSNDLLNSINNIETEVFDISTLYESSEVTLKINIPEGVSVEDKINTVKVKFNINNNNNNNNNDTSINEPKEIIRSITCNVKYENLKEGYVLDNSNSSVVVQISGVQSELEKIADSDISAIVDLSNVSQEGSYTYTPKVSINNPSIANISDVGSVSVTIKKTE